MRSAAAVVVLLAMAATVHGAMYDVIQESHIPDPSCECEAWANVPGAAELWSDPSRFAKAGSSCAQPAHAVDKYPIGDWCYCKAQPHPSAGHPLNGSVVYAVANGNQSSYLSFTNADAPPQHSVGCAWMRVGYNENEAMPLRLTAVDGQSNTYLMYNLWPEGGDFVSFTWDGFYMRAHYDAKDAMPIRLEPDATHPGQYLFANLWFPNNVTYVTAQSDRWVRADASQALATSFKLTTAPPTIAYCGPQNGIPEQINVQAASPDTVVVGFVTFEATAPSSPPIIEVGRSATALSTTLTGVTHVHTTAAADRTYYLHFVRLSGLEPRQRYFYRVKSGTSKAVYSDTFSFRAGYATGTTKIDIYGDMGVYSWNNMANLEKDCATGDAADLIVHAGDHAYNEGEDDERRGDGYMNAFQRVIASCPWVPVVGNHEFYDGTELSRYLNQTWQGWGPIAGGTVPSSTLASRVVKGRSTATSALGALLSTGNHHGAGVHGSTASNTSRYFSIDFGLVHLIALDLNVYYGVDACGDACRQAQLDWLKKDLQAAVANRKNVPWIIGTSHYPFYCTGCFAKQIPAQWYASDGAETLGNANYTAAAAWEEEEVLRMAQTGIELDAARARERIKFVRQSSNESIQDLMPIITEAKMDMFIAGHWHYYESLWPAQVAPTGTGGPPLQNNFVNPTVPVHVTTGNAGPPSKASFHMDCPGPDCGRIPSTRFQSLEFGYARLVAHNSTHLDFLQFANGNSSVIDEFTIVQEHH